MSDTSDDARPAESAAQLAARLGDSLPDPADIPAAHLELVHAVRALTEAVVATDIGAPERAEIAATLATLTHRLRSMQRDPLIRLARHPNGRLENLTQAGAGRLNPQAPPVVFDHHEVHTESPPVAVEICGRVTLTAAHSGPPGKAHGGVVATILDEALGVAATAAGATGLTAGLNLSYKAATPYGVELSVRARYTGSEGRKHFATGELTHGTAVCAVAEAVFVAPRAGTPPEQHDKH